MANNGARHIIVPGGPSLNLGTPDAEPDGQPTVDADGDDNNEIDDEDGVGVPLLFAGQQALIGLSSSSTAYLNAWIDYNGDGDWNDTGEQIATDVQLMGGTAVLPVMVPIDAVPGTSYARFRYSSQTGLSPVGLAPDGEVEDYLVTVSALDFGDLPDTPYPTLLINNGPRHTITALTLGLAIDNEADGQPNATATGDDLAGATPDDEAGVTFPGLIAGQTATVVVNASGAGQLNAFFDWNNDGDFGDAGEVIAELGVGAGDNNLSVPVPIGALTGTSLGARFR